MATNKKPEDLALVPPGEIEQVDELDDIVEEALESAEVQSITQEAEQNLKRAGVIKSKPQYQAKKTVDQEVSRIFRNAEANQIKKYVGTIDKAKIYLAQRIRNPQKRREAEDRVYMKQAQKIPKKLEKDADKYAQHFEKQARSYDTTLTGLTFQILDQEALIDDIDCLNDAKLDKYDTLENQIAETRDNLKELTKIVQSKSGTKRREASAQQRELRIKLQAYETEKQGLREDMDDLYMAYQEKTNELKSLKAESAFYQDCKSAFTEHARYWKRAGSELRQVYRILEKLEGIPAPETISDQGLEGNIKIFQEIGSRQLAEKRRNIDNLPSIKYTSGVTLPGVDSSKRDQLQKDSVERSRSLSREIAASRGYN